MHWLRKTLLCAALAGGQVAAGPALEQAEQPLPPELEGLQLTSAETKAVNAAEAGRQRSADDSDAEAQKLPWWKRVVPVHSAEKTEVKERQEQSKPWWNTSVRDGDGATNDDDDAAGADGGKDAGADDGQAPAPAAEDPAAEAPQGGEAVAPDGNGDAATPAVETPKDAGLEQAPAPAAEDPAAEAPQGGEAVAPDGNGDAATPAAETEKPERKSWWRRSDKAEGEAQPQPEAQNGGQKREAQKASGDQLKEIQQLTAGIRCNRTYDKQIEAKNQLVAMGEVVIPEVEKLLDDTLPLVRTIAVVILRDIKSPAAYPILYRLLDDPDSQVRYQAIIALRTNTGMDLGYYAFDLEARRQEAMKKWQAWLVEQGLMTAQKEEPKPAPAETAKTPTPTAAETKPAEEKRRWWWHREEKAAPAATPATEKKSVVEKVKGAVGSLKPDFKRSTSGTDSEEGGRFGNEYEDY